MKDQKHSSEQIRVNAVKAVLGGQSIESVSRSYNCNRSTIHRWLATFKGKRRFSALATKPRSGRPAGLSEEDGKFLYRAILKPATKFGFETDFWTCRRVIQLAKRELKTTISQPTMWRNLRTSGLTYQKPEKRYLQASQKDKDEWIQSDLPKIRAAVARFKAILYFQDEASIALAPVLARTWAPKGKTPTQAVTGKRGSVSAMSAISSAGHLIFSLCEKRIASKQVIRFLEQMLRHHPRRHLVVIMDQASPHVSKLTKAFVASQKRLHVFYLPPYSPEFNADEKVWSHLKHQELQGHQAIDKKGLKKTARKRLDKMARDPSLIRGIFFRCCIAELMN
jgi:transposase